MTHFFLVIRVRIRSPREQFHDVDPPLQEGILEGVDIIFTDVFGKNLLQVTVFFALNFVLFVEKKNSELIFQVSNQLFKVPGMFFFSHSVTICNNSTPSDFLAFLIV